eukprot:TRINITY_DN9739_c0_g1_i3.p1 TRINITY_DN9739_c0_g1~~TRINITY_DN9739_c0_g1_i3.p1  ORF type:complete len:275 (+),score=102.10 TRINITY_DN9739_c0_g1_i3:73-897(+)
MAVAPGGPPAAGAEAATRHQAAAEKLRAEVAALVEQARVLLHGDAGKAIGDRKAGYKGAAAISAAARQNEMEHALERTEFLRKENRKLKRQLEGVWDRVGNGPSNPHDRDPMEIQNMLADKRRELQRLRKSGEGLDRLADAQRRAEAEGNRLSPKVEERMRKVKGELETFKRQHAKLQMERTKVGTARKKADEEVRAAGEELRQRAAELRGASEPPKGKGKEESESQKLVKILKRDVDILQQAVKQDERKFKLAVKEDAQEMQLSANSFAFVSA